MSKPMCMVVYSHPCPELQSEPAQCGPKYEKKVMKVENRVSTVESTTRICFIIHHDDEMMAPDSDLVVYDAEFRAGSTVESDSPSMVSATLIWC